MSAALDTCGCLPREDAAPATFNRPGLPALDYRIGTHAELLRRMLRRIAGWYPPEDQHNRPLAELTSRTPDDPAIALLDAWAVVGDVLAFYQERIANEGYLRTATERLSVLQLAREIGYELNPGVAAGTYLVWEVEQRFAIEGQTPPNMPPPAREVLVAGGTKVQSLPGQNEMPQTFETGADLVARSDVNELRPRLTVPQPVSLGSRQLYIEGIATGFARGDRVLITAPATAKGLRKKTDLPKELAETAPSDVAPPPGVDISVLEVTAVVPESDRGRTRLELDVLPKQPPASHPPAPTVNPPVPDPPFIPPEPPPLPDVTPAVIQPPVMVLVPRPLTTQEILDRILNFAWHNPWLMAEIALLGWNPGALIDAINRAHIGLDLGPVFELVQVVPARDITRPTVISVFPKDKTEAAANTVVVVRFSEPMNPATAMDAVTVTDAAKNKVDLAKAYDVATGSVTLTLKEGHEFGSGGQGNVTYTVSVADTAIDLATPPNSLAGSVTTTFVVPDQTRPKLIDVDPNHPGIVPVEPGELGKTTPGVPVTTHITARFTEVLFGVSADTFFLRDGTGTRVAADWVASDGGKTITLTPRAPLAPSMHYTATLTEGITDGAAPKPNPIFPVEWSFTTVPRAPVAPKAELAVYGFREKTGFFGNNAPRWESLPKPAEGTQRAPGHDPWEFSWDDPARSVWVDSQGSSLGGDAVRLDREVRGLEGESWAIFETATGAAVYYVTNVSATSVADYGISGRSSRLVLSQRDGRSPCEGAGAPPDFRVREAAAHVSSERLTLVELPVDEPLHAGDTQIVLDNMVIGLEKGRLIALRGELVDLPGAIENEILVLEESIHAGGFTTLILERPGLQRTYVRKTVTMSANVVPATHGETVAREVLGGGDGSQANQRFALRKRPLTYVSAITPSGSASTLELRVDGVRWDEAPVLYGLGPRGRRYIVRRSDDGIPSVIFGDGEEGARPPTGAQNIVATYRTGVGTPGALGADRLTLLLQRPLGIASVTNPLATTGAADPQTRDAARENAPLTVLTMERIVSLQDFEDFARAFAGIGKAQAIAIWRGASHVVHLTVAPAGAGVIQESSALFKSLVGAVHAASEPGLSVQVDLYRRRYFDLEAAVRVEPAYRAADVLDAVRGAVLAAFSFPRRAFSQPVTAAEVIQVIEGVPGVVATYLKSLYQFAADIPIQLGKAVPNPFDPVLFVRQAHVDGIAIVPAELLLVNPAGVTITERTG